MNNVKEEDDDEEELEVTKRPVKKVTNKSVSDQTFFDVNIAVRVLVYKVLKLSEWLRMLRILLVLVKAMC